MNQRKKRAARKTRRQARLSASPHKPVPYSYRIDTLDDVLYLNPNQVFFLYCRASLPQQEKSGALARQARRLSAEARVLGLRVINNEPFKEVGSGSCNKHIETLKTLCKIFCEDGILILAESADRFIRPKSYNPKTNPSALPTRQEMDCYKGTGGFVSVLPPDWSAAKIKEFQSTVEQGLPTKHHIRGLKQRKERYLKRVLQLRRKDVSYGVIAKQLNLPKSTIIDWVKKVYT